MARQFKTSRVSVREAYRSLEELGLLRIRRGAEGGAFIAKFDHEPVRRSLSLVFGLGKTSHNEVTEARMLLEPTDRPARGAARASRRHRQARAGPAPGRRGSARRGRLRRDRRQFHRAIADCAGNVPLVVLMNALADLTAESVSAIDLRTRSKHRRKNCEYHREIFEAIRAHDGEGAYALMLQHVGDIQDRVGRTMKQVARNSICGPTPVPASRAGANGESKRRR